MDTNVQALKGLYAALGGEAADVADLQTSAEVIVALEAVAEAAATELPAVTSADNGKRLGVESGKWKKVDDKYVAIIHAATSPSGGGYRITSFVDDDHLNWTANKFTQYKQVYLMLYNLMVNSDIYLNVQLAWNGMKQIVGATTYAVFYFSGSLRAEGKTIYVDLSVPSNLTAASDATLTVREVADPVADPTVPEA